MEDGRVTATRGPESVERGLMLWSMGLAFEVMSSLFGLLWGMALLQSRPLEGRSFTPMAEVMPAWAWALIPFTFVTLSVIGILLSTSSRMWVCLVRASGLALAILFWAITTIVPLARGADAWSLVYLHAIFLGAALLASYTALRGPR